jgi:hypothetical protein
MAEGYRLSDFLLFSARVYDRIFIRHFEAFGALSLLLALAALLALGALVWRGRLPGRPVLAALAGIWLWVGASFLWWLYLPINWAIGWWLPVFGLQALLLAGIAWRTPPTLGLPYRSEVVPAAVLLLGGLLLWPLLTGEAGWRSAAVFGAAPDPTALLCLGLLPLLGGRARWLLLPIPALWCGFSGATLLALERSVGGGLLLTAPLLAIAGCWLAGRPTRA